MNQRRAPFLIGLVAAALLLLHGPAQPSAETQGGTEAPPQLPAAVSTGSTTATKSQEPAALAPARTAASRREYARLYRDLLGIDRAKPEHDKASTRRARGSLGTQPLSLEISAEPDQISVADADLCEIAAAARRSGYHLAFMIALVPDPLDSGLVSDFDLTMRGLQSGLAEAGYRLDRQWLPWVEPEAAEAKAYRETAGLMLFRRERPSVPAKGEANSQPYPQLLAVFVVGETLKLGIHKPAFERAVDFILDLHAQDVALPLDSGPLETAAPPPYASCPEIPVLGPSSSGSVTSLRLALDRTRPGTCFRIVSGSASAPNLEVLMAEPLPGNAEVKVRFSRTVISDDDLAERGLRFLKERLGWHLDRAALLVESDTAYGSYFSGLSQESPANPLLARITKLHFPSGLIPLRNAWEASAGAAPAPAAAGSLKAAAPKTALEVSLADQRTPVDVLPEMSPLTARIYDMALADLLRQIKSEGFSYIGILATDVKDQLFLAEEVRRWAPGAILFVIDNNLLYVHPQYNATTFGMLTISSFPLSVEGSQRSLSLASLEPRTRRQFASERQEGIFLAVRSLVSGLPPRDRAIWIAACGNYAIWPLARLEPDPSEAPTAYPASSELDPLGPSQRYATPDWQQAPPQRLDLNLAFLAFLACAVSRLLRQEASSWARVQPLTRRWLSAATALLWLAGAFLVALCATSLWAAARQGDARPAWTLAPWRSWVLLGFLLLGYSYLWHSLVVTSGRRTRFARSLAICLLLLALPWAAFAPWSIDDPALFYLRARAFTGGVSPLVSLAWFAVACFFWLVVELKRQWVRRRHQVPWPLARYHDPALAGCRDRAERIEKLLAATFPPSSGAWLAMLAVVAPPVVFLLTRMQPIAESRVYGVAFVLIAAVLSILSAMTFFRFLWIWWLLRGVLRRVQQTDLLAALKEVAAEMEWNPTRFAWYQPNFVAVRRSVERLQWLIDREVVADPPGHGHMSALPGRIFKAASRHRYENELAWRDELNDRCEQAGRLLADRRAVPGVEPFYAVRLVAWLRHVFNQLRYSVMGAMGCDLALIVGASTFAFQPKSFLTLALWSTLVAASAATLMVFVQMERDATLSAIGGSETGKISYNWAFLSKLLVYGALPVLGLVASQFPAMGRLLNSLFDPLARILGTGS